MRISAAAPRPHRLLPARRERLAWREWPALLKRALSAFLAQGMADWAAVLAYHAIMALVPVLLVAAALLTLIGSDSLPETIAGEFFALVRDETSGTSAGEAANAVEGLVRTALENAQRGAGITLVVSLLLALNGASGAFAAAGRALNRIHHVEDARGIVRGKLASVGLATVVIVLMAAAGTLLVVGGEIADDVFAWLGLEQEPGVWAVLRIPLALIALLFAINVVFTFAPDIPARGMRLFSAGALTALAVWTVATAFLVAYVRIAGFGSAYGALGGAIVLLFWLYLSAAAFLLGGQVDAEAERTVLMRDREPPAIHGGAVVPEPAVGD